MIDVGGPSVGMPEDDAVLRAKEQFDDVIELLGQTKERLMRGEVAVVRDISSQVTLVMKTLIALSEARGRLDENMHGTRADGVDVMDLAAAKLEVGRRLDRLRPREHAV